MGRYKYSDSEKEMNKVLKMQENQLVSLDGKIEQQSDDLQQMRAELEELLKKKGINPNDIAKTSSNSKYESKIKIDKSDIPTWDNIVSQANEQISGDIELEDLLTKEEFQFCIDEVERINDDFSKKTNIFNKKDMSFLMVATALQTARWLIIQEFCGDLGQKIDPDSRLAHNDKGIKDKIKNSNKQFQDYFKEYGHRESNKGHKSWQDIIFNGAPYDISKDSWKFGESLEGKYHRYKTIGHDPILGWIFGTANFITDTCTLSNWNSYKILRNGSPHFAYQTDLVTIFGDTFDSIQEDWLRLPAGLFAQFVHLKSDVFTKLGLPVPLLSTFSETLAGNLYRSQYDSLCLLKDIKIVGNQAGWSIFINMIISLLHGFMYDEQKDINRELYEVRTRKILSISNFLASSGNIAYSVILNDWKKLDVGGILVTLHRLFSDVRFITRIKQDFIEKEMDKVLEKELKEIESYFY